MSKQFRDTFIQLFVAGRCCRRGSSMSASHTYHTAAAVCRDTHIPLDHVGTGITVIATCTSKHPQIAAAESHGVRLA